MRHSIVFISMAVLSLTACAQNKSVSSKPIGMTNPASEYCVKQGGKSEIKRNADGS